MASESQIVYVNGEYVPREQAYDLYAADEIFLTSTAGGIMPLVEIDGRAIGDSRPGPVFQRVNDLYWALRESGRDGTSVFLDSVESEAASPQPGRRRRAHRPRSPRNRWQRLWRRACMSPGEPDDGPGRRL